MEQILIPFCIIFFVVAIVLVIKIVVMKKSVKEIEVQFAKLVDGNTNALISISSADKSLAKLACSLNENLKELRQKELTYLNGDKELKNAITNVAHDIRTPLTAICGYADMIKEEKDIDNIQKYIAIVSQRATTLKTLSEELFKYSVATDNSNELSMEKVNVGVILQETLFSFYSRFSEKNIVPNIKNCENNVMRMTDKNSLTRIFSNIIDNAIKYSDGDFTVSIKEDGEINFTNTARNLDNVDVEKLFDRFFTVENGKNSTGLGLSIAKLLTKQLGGDIYAKYNNGTLTITLKI